MRRIIVALLVVSALTLASSGTAMAKGAFPQSANMSGPGLRHPIIFRDAGSSGGPSSRGNLALLASETYLLQTLYGGSQTTDPASTAKLGPRYTITWTLRREPHPNRTFEVESELYPYAAGGAVMYTHGGQTIHEGGSSFVLRSGWSTPNPVLVANLHAWGLPKESEATAASSSAASSTPWWAISLILLLVVVTAAVRILRVDRSSKIKSVSVPGRVSG